LAVTADLLGICETASADDAHYVDVYLPFPGALKAVGITGAELVSLLQDRSGGDRLTADAIQDGSTNGVLTLTNRTNLLAWLAKEGGYDTFKAKEGGYDTFKAKEGSYDTFKAKEGGYDTFKAKEAAYDAVVAAEPQYEVIENEFDLSVSNIWADAIPVGSTVVGYRYINMTTVVATTGVSYKINITGGATADLETGIGFAKNDKNSASRAELAITSVAGVVNLTPNDGTLDTGTVKVGILIRKPLDDYPDEA
jgi:hypothetical protein